MTLARWYTLFFGILSTACISSNDHFALAESRVASPLLRYGASNVTRTGLVSFPLVPHHVQRRRRKLEVYNIKDKERSGNVSEVIRRSASSSTQQVGQLYLGYGTHYVDLWCGTPAQRQTVIVDTGSGITGFPCTGCHDCGENEYHTDDLYRFSQSSTFHKYTCSECRNGARCSNRECRTALSYQEGSSWSAFVARDKCYIGGPHTQGLEVTGENDEPSDGLDPQVATSYAFDLTFGCQTKLTGLFKTQLADGILGMDSATNAYWRQLSEAGKMNEDVFTMCFSRPKHVDREGTEAGALTLGGYDERFHQSPLVYAKTDKNSGFYNVKLRKIYLQEAVEGSGESAIKPKVPTGKIHRLNADESKLMRTRNIVDSGTTDSYLSSQIKLEFMEKYLELTGKKYDHKSYDLTGDEIDAMPTILLQLAGDIEANAQIANGDPSSVPGLAGYNDIDPDNPYDIIVAITPRQYMEFDEDVDKYVARVYLDEYSIVMGANSMIGHDVVFDIERSRVGFAESDCNYAHLLEENGYSLSVPTRTKKNSGSTKKNDVPASETVPDKKSKEIFVPASSSVEEDEGICDKYPCPKILFVLVAIICFVVIVTILLRSRARRREAIINAAVRELELPSEFDEEDDEDFGDGIFKKVEQYHD